MATFTLRVTSSATNTAGTAFSTLGNQQADLGAPSFYDVQITNSSDPVGMPNGIYDAYCLDPEVIIRTVTNYSGSNSQANDPTDFQNITPSDPSYASLTQAQVDQLNWLLAQNFTSAPQFGGQYNYGEVQIAIWKILGFTDPQIAVVDVRWLNHNNDTNPLAAINSGNVNFLVQQAQAAVASGQNVVPTNTFFSTILDPAGTIQPLIITLQNAKLGNYVWFDQDGDGLQDANEVGVNNVVVELYKNGLLVASTITGDDFSTAAVENGFYQFAGLAAGNYQVKFVPSSAYEFTTANADSNNQDSIDSDANALTGLSQVVTLAAGEYNQTIDAGLVNPAASIAGFVYCDDDNDGIKDAGEVGLGGVPVRLQGTNDLGQAVDITLNSNPDGSYSFTGLRPGTYSVTETTQPAGKLDGKDTAGSLGGNTTVNEVISGIVLGAGQSSVNNNFGEVLASSISGFVYCDDDNDGIKDAGEVGLGGVPVRLQGTNDLGQAVDITLNTNPDGTYSFTGLRPGTYSVTETTQPAGKLDGKDTAGSLGGNTTVNEVISGIVLGAGQSSTNNNFGEVLASSISGFVYCDDDNDGVKDAGEVGLGGVPVRLQGTNDLGQAVDITLNTNTDGSYSFAGLRPGTYSVTETAQPVGKLDGIDTAGSLGGNTTVNEVISGIVLGAGQSSTNNNFGEVLAGVISGFVYCDDDNDGVKDAGEVGLGGVPVRLTGTNDLGQAVDITTNSAADGSYSFTGLRPGTYSVTETAQPAGKLDGKDTAGSLGGDTTVNEVISGIVLGAGQSSTNNNFGEVLASSISGFVYCDDDNDGVKDAGEVGLGGVPVRLQGTNDLGQAVDVTINTAADGSYSFTGLRPGTYSVTETTQPVGKLDGKDTAGNLGGNTTVNEVISGIVLGSGQSSTNNNFGEVLASSISGFVYCDDDNDGVKDAGEVGLGGAPVRLQGSNDLGQAVDVTINTAADGSYSFTGLRPGTYSVTETAQPAGKLDGKDTAGSLGGNTTVNEVISGIVLGAGQSSVNNNFGEIRAIVGIDIEKFVQGVYTMPGDGAAEGLTPGFWKTHSAAGPAPLAGWPETGRSPGDSYEAVFGVNVPGTPSLLDALNSGGGGINALLRHSTAALLNASNPFINYDYTVAEVIQMTQAAITSANYEPTKNLFATQNELGADLTDLGGGVVTVTTAVFDADTTGSGPVIPTGGTALFTYEVKNTGNFELSSVVVSDDRLGTPLFVGGDTDNDGKLDLNETWRYTASEVVNGSGDQVNIGTASGTNAFGQSATDSDAAHYDTNGFSSSLGDRVFEDTNANGVQDVGELGIAGVTVLLLSLANNVLASQVTDSNGNYLFDVTPGTYKVGIVPLTGFVVSPNDRGGNDNTDSDILAVSNMSAPVTIAAGEQNLTLDAGLYRVAKLSGYVYEDVGNDGVRNAEPGINNVLITLTGTDDLGNIISATTVTNALGYYEFANLRAGTYTTSESQPANFLDGKETAGTTGGNVTVNDKISGIALTAGQNSQENNFGELKAATIGNRVWLDCNSNGIQDNGELGVANVTVKLLNGAGVEIATQVTNANGEYQFTGLNAGEYAVKFVPLAGYNFTSKDANNNNSDTLDSDADIVTGRTVTTTLTSGEVDLTWDAGLAPVCRPVTFDFSGNSGTDGTDGNSRSYSDTLTGVSVTARAFSQDKGTNTWQKAFLGAYGGGLGVTDSTEGNGSGNTHTVDNVGRNNYIVLHFSQDVLVDKAFLGYVSGDSDAQIWVGNAASAITTMNNSVLNGAAFTEVNTTTLTTARWADFNASGVRGNLFIIAADTTDTSPEDYFKLEKVSICAPDLCAPVAKASIGNYVWEDKDYDGVQDGNEVGIKNVTVNLLNSAGTVLTTTTTDLNGAYAFTNLNPGDYKVQVVTPSGYFVTKKDIGGNTLASDALDSDIDSTGTTALTTLTAGENDTTWDAGFYRKASVGDKVWEDKNHNWLQDGTDPGIGGVKVALMDASGTTVLQTTTTNTSGNYAFVDLDPGTYVLRFDKGNVIYNGINMNNWMWGVKDVGSNDTIDSDVTGDGIAKTNVTKTDAFTLMSGQADMTRDAAITPIVIDLDGDGIQTVSRANSGGTFDLFGNGAGIHSGWVSGGDGFLAVDKNGNGQVESINELFGGIAKGAGFANLAAYDSNHDGVVDNSDANFADLLIWRDANGNHATDAGELSSLTESGIASLAVAYTEVPFLDAQGNLHLERSTATLADGSSVAMTDVYFNVSVDDAAAAGVTLPTIGELLGNDSSLDGLLAGLGVAPTASAQVASDKAFDTGAADAMKQMAQLYDQSALAA